MKPLQLIPTNLLPGYLQQVQDITAAFEQLEEAKISTETFSFYTSISAIASSKIEGETLEIDSYVKYKMLNIEYKNNLVEKPNDLYNAYVFAQANSLTAPNFLKAHQLISSHLLTASKQGK